MAIARAKLVDLTVTRWYHCVSRCVRKAFLLGEGDHNRREWLENRLEELAEIFAVAVGGFAVMHNHLHVLLRLDPEVAQGWSDLEVVQRWGRLFPPRDKFRQPIPVTDQAGRIHRPALSAGEGLYLGGTGWDLRAAGFYCRELARRDGQSPGRAFAGPHLCGQPHQTTGNRQTTWCAAPGQLDGLSVALKRSSISKRGDPQSLDRPVRMLNPACTSPTSS
jgi:hypothetical protein